MKSTSLMLLGFGLEATAFPAAVYQVLSDQLEKRQTGVPSTAAAVALSKARTNCGPIPCTVFNAEEQLVSVSGQNAFVPPGADDIRGPCPGLNAAANHNYLPHSGIATIQETIAGLGAAYGLSAEACGFLAAYAIIFDGDPIEGTWSIGGPPPSDPLSGGLLGGAQGISYSHNVYEGDTSIGRNDAYINHGDAVSLNVSRFASAYAATSGPDSYSLDSFVQNFQAKVFESIANNPYYFSAPFATLAVSPAAYNFVINFMSNHSAAEPSGYLNGAIFKEFFSVTGDTPSEFVWKPGYEKIPDNWYRRPSSEQYTLAQLGGDLAIGWAAYPNSFRLGGNTNGVNTYAGIDLGDLTGGAYNVTYLLDSNGNGAACFFAQLAQAAIPDALATTLGELSAITDLVNQYIKPVTGSLECPIVDKYDQTLFNKFPGWNYRPTNPS